MTGSQTETINKTHLEDKTKKKSPKMYSVIILNDDYTPMDFVVMILKKFFKKNETEAEAIMLQIHHKGRGIAGVYTLEVAETKMYQVNTFAEQNEHPLQAQIEEA